MSWVKILGLSKDILEKQGEEVMVVFEEKRDEKDLGGEKFLGRKKRREIPPVEWLPDHNQGQLKVDVYNDERNNVLIIESIIAGVNSKDIDITVEPDLIVIRGQREKPKSLDPGQYYYQECFWGKFFRTLVLPCPIKPDQVKANLKNGVLTIVLPKAEEGGDSIKIEE